MTNRIDSAFSRLRCNQESALIPFVTSGDPSLAATEEILLSVGESGADLVEVGVPFSDPTSDGPILQRSSQLALDAGSSLPATMRLISDFRQKSELPVVLYGYYNPIFRYGVEAFARDARQAGIDGILVVDLPPEEVQELLPMLKQYGLHFIFLLAPTSGPERRRLVLRHASGFVYYVSVTGVTGVRPMMSEAVRPRVEELRQSTKVPIGVGFGITTPEQAASVASFADAAVVGSAIMRTVDEHRDSPKVASAVGEFVASLKQGMRSLSASQK